MAQNSAFKLLWTEVFKQNGDLSKVDQKLFKQQIKCFVKESYPYFLLADDYFYVPAYFPKKSIEQFKQKFPKVDITDLKSEVIIIKDWDLELVKVDSTQVFTSYAGVELRLIVKSFSLQVGKEKPSLQRYPVNIYRDGEIKTLIQNFVYTNQASQLNSSIKAESLPSISNFTQKAAVSQGVVKFAQGENFNVTSIKDAVTPVMTMEQIYKLEKGVAPANKATAGKVVRPKVKAAAGDKSPKKKIIKKASKTDAALTSKIAKFTPGAGKRTGKKSLARASESAPVPSPGEGKSEGATTDLQTMKQFKKMVEFLKKTKAGKSTLGKKVSKK